MIALLAAAPEMSQHRGGAHRPQPLVIDFDHAYTCASAQVVASGKNSVGEQRGTPVVSTWDAKPFEKAIKKFGQWWTLIQRDGDALIKGTTVIEPMMLQAYYRLLPDGSVLQLAWARPDYRLGDEREIVSEKGTFFV